MNRTWLLGVLLLVCSNAFARGRVQGFCQQGAITVSVPGGAGPSVNRFQQSLPGSTVTVYFSGTTTLATLYSDDNGTAQANPFTCPTSSTTATVWFFYADNGRYDVKVSGTGVTTPFTMGDFQLIDAIRPQTVRIAEGFSPSSTDKGVQINAALADIGTAGGEIWVTKSGTVSTQILINNQNNIRIRCVTNPGGAGTITLTDGITGNPADPMILVEGSSTGFEMTGCYNQGNGVSGNGGNGHGISVISTNGSTPIFVTIRDSYFVSFKGNGKDQSGASMLAAGIYAYRASVLRVDGNKFSSNQYGSFIDSLTKFSAHGNDFDSNLKNGIYGISSQGTLSLDNTEISGYNIFNNNGSGSSTDGGIYLDGFNDAYVVGNRFKLSNANDFLTGSTGLNTGLTFEGNYIYRSSISSTTPSVTVSSNTEGFSVSRNTFLLDFTTRSAIGIRLTDGPGGFVVKAGSIQGNKFSTSQANATVLDKAIDLAATSGSGITVENNYIGDDTAGLVGETINTGINVGAGFSEVGLIRNTCTNGANRTFTTCINVASGATNTLEIGNKCGFNITNCLTDPNATSLSFIGGNLTYGIGSNSSLAIIDIRPLAGVLPFFLKTAAGNTANLFTVQDNTSSVYYVVDPNGAVYQRGLAFASLPAANTGTILYCTDCKNVVDNAAVAGAACVAGGGGSFAKRQNGRWDCN